MRPHYLTFAAKLNRAIRLRQQQGASLVVSLLMLVAVLLLGISAAQIALQGEKSSRNDRDRQIAFQSAEAALLDAEMDIEKSPDATNTRSALFSEKSGAINFVAGCGSGDGNKNLGLCVMASSSEKPVWLLVDFTDENSTSTKSVPFGKFTGQILQTGNGPLPSKLPRYIIEEVPYNLPGSVPGEKFYRITAMGFGVRETTQAVLQSFYRKIDQ